MASAKFAKRTVNQSQSVIWSRKPVESPLPPVMSRTVVTAAPTSVTNMTGLATRVSGLSLTNDCPMAGPIMAGSKMDCFLAAMEVS